MKDTSTEHLDSRKKGCLHLFIAVVVAAIVTHLLLVFTPNRDDSAAAAILAAGGEIQRTDRLLMLSAVIDTPLYPRGDIWDVTIRNAEIDGSLARHLSSLRSLYHLSLNRCQVPPGMKTPLIPASKDLRSVYISDSNFGDAQLTSLASCPNLWFLALEGTEVTDASVPVICKCRKLNVIHFERSKLTDKGIATIRASFPTANFTTEP
jgi:hypothetical protein